MNYNFFLLDRSEKDDGTKIGYAYAIANKDKWITVDSSSICDYLTVGFGKGGDHIVHDGKAYMLMNSYTDIDSKETIFVCVESIAGCDNKKNFTNINNSTIIVDRPTKDDEEEAPVDTPVETVKSGEAIEPTADIKEETAEPDDTENNSDDGK